MQDNTVATIAAKYAQDLRRLAEQEEREERKLALKAQARNAVIFSRTFARIRPTSEATV